MFLSVAWLVVQLIHKVQLHSAFWRALIGRNKVGHRKSYEQDIRVLQQSPEQKLVNLSDRY